MFQFKNKNKNKELYCKNKEKKNKIFFNKILLFNFSLKYFLKVKDNHYKF